MVHVIKKFGFVLTLTLLVLVMAALVGSNAALAANAEEKQVQAATDFSQDQTEENSCFLKNAVGVAGTLFAPDDAWATEDHTFTSCEEYCKRPSGQWNEYGCQKNQWITGTPTFCSENFSKD